MSLPALDVIGFRSTFPACSPHNGVKSYTLPKYETQQSVGTLCTATSDGVKYLGLEDIAIVKVQVTLAT